MNKSGGKEGRGGDIVGVGIVYREGVNNNRERE